MTPSLFNSSTIPALEATVHFTEARHDVLAGNIANLDTPGYQLRDLSLETFQKRLRAALEARQERPEPWSPGLHNSQPGDPLREVRDGLPGMLRHDENNVGLEQQVLEVSKNQFLHNLAIALLGSQFRLMQVAISERV